MDRLLEQRSKTKMKNKKTNHIFSVRRRTQSKAFIGADKSHLQNQPEAITVKENYQIPPTALLARRSPIDMSLPGRESHITKLFVGPIKWKKIRSLTITSSAIALVLMMTLGGLFLSQSYLKVHKVFRGTAPTADALTVSHEADLLNGQSSGRVNVLLLGRDGGGSNNPNTTNTMMVASIDTVNDTMTLVSVPGNLWVSAPAGGVMKLDQVWQTTQTPSATPSMSSNNGYDYLDKTVTQVLGLDINYNVMVNLQSVSQIVDEVGGISVNVTAPLIDPTMAWQNNQNPTLVNSGTQTLSGRQALLYMMSKETSTDSAREQRQRQVLAALFDKIISTNFVADPLKLNSLINSFSSNVDTDLSISNADKLYNLVKNINANNVQSVDLSSGSSPYVVSGNAVGQAILLPQAGLFNYSAIHTYLSSQLKNPYFIKEDAKIIVLNGTNTQGLATATGEKLNSQDFDVIGESNTPTSNWTKTTLYNVSGSDLHTQAALEQELHIKVSTKAINKSIPTDGANFVIIIGSNEANTSQN